MLEAEAEVIEKAAEEIAPGFDYEKEAAELEAEENKKQINSRFLRFFLRDKHQKTLGVTLLMLVGVLGWWICDFVIPLCQSELQTAMIGGEEVEIRVLPGTVEETLEYNDIKYDRDDIITPALDEMIEPGVEIAVDYVEYECVDKTEKIKSEHYVKLDPKTESGEEYYTEGNDGEGIFTYKTKYVNGEKQGTERELKEWIVEPHDAMHVLGTKRTGHKGRYKITNTFTANCSAYWMGDNCYGASGGRCVYGTVAVDRHKYPYGTMFWIKGYGFAVANDCGTSIKGDKLDLWMDSYAESCRWGRRHMTTYVLEKE